MRTQPQYYARVIAYLSDCKYLGNQRAVSWHDSLSEESPENYICRMATSGTYGDHITLQTISEIFQVQILVVSSLNGGTTLLRPDGSNCFTHHIPTLVLGHISENHYVSLSGDDSNLIDIVQASSQIWYDGNGTNVNDTNVNLNSTNVNGTDVHVKNSTNNKQEPVNFTMAKNHSVSIVEIKPLSTDTAVRQLPTEIWDMIIQFALISQNILTYQRLTMVSKLFYATTMRYPRPALPRLYFNPSVSGDLGLDNNEWTEVSVRSIFRKAGKSSGLAMNVRLTLSDLKKWYNAMLILKAVKFGWFLIHHVKWNKKR